MVKGWGPLELGNLAPLLGLRVLSCILFPTRAEVAHACAVASEAEGGNVVSQMWEGVARMTARARESTQSFLESSVLCVPPTAGGAFACPHLTSPRLALPISEIELCLKSQLAAISKLNLLIAGSGRLTWT